MSNPTPTPAVVETPAAETGPLFTILHRWSGAVLWTGHAVSMGKAVEAAVAARADLRRADLSDANLSAANLSAANLSAADLSDADLSDARSDFFSILDSAVAEVPALLVAVREGRIDGSTYTGLCACLVGTIANARGVSYDDLTGIRPNSDRPAERFFTAISEGDTPENHAAARVVEAWILDWQKAHPVAETPAT